MFSTDKQYVAMQSGNANAEQLLPKLERILGTDSIAYWFMTYDEIEDLYKSLQAEKWPVEWEFIVRDSPFSLTGKEIAIQYLDEKQDVFFVFEFYQKPSQKTPSSIRWR